MNCRRDKKKIRTVFSKRKGKNVLSTVVNSCVADTQTSKSSITSDTCDVYGALFNWIFSRTKTMYYLQPSISRCSLIDLLQWRWKLFVLE